MGWQIPTLLAFQAKMYCTPSFQTEVAPVTWGHKVNKKWCRAAPLTPTSSCREGVPIARTQQQSSLGAVTGKASRNQRVSQWKHITAEGLCLQEKPMAAGFLVTISMAWRTLSGGSVKLVEYKPTSGLVVSRGSRLRPAWPFDPCPGASLGFHPPGPGRRTGEPGQLAPCLC